MFASTMTNFKKSSGGGNTGTAMKSDKPNKIGKRMDSELETNPNSPGGEDDYLLTPWKLR